MEPGEHIAAHRQANEHPAAPPTALRPAVEPVRGTPEYAAAFDLELWKAEEMRRFRESLESLSRKKEAEIVRQLELQDAIRVEELQRYRAELDEMARGLKSATERLQKRTELVEVKEAGLADWRLEVSRKNDDAITDVEARTRRALEELRGKLSAEESKCREKEHMIAHTLTRLAAANREAERLQALLQSVNSRDSEAHARLAEAHLQMEHAAQDLRDARNAASTASRERDSALKENAMLREAAFHYRAQLESVVLKHNELLVRYRALEQDQLATARTQIDRDRAHLQHAAAMHAKHPSSSAAPTSVDILSQRAAGGSNAGQSEEIAQVRRLIERLIAFDDRDAEAFGRQGHHHSKKEHRRHRGGGDHPRSSSHRRHHNEHQHRRHQVFDHVVESDAELRGQSNKAERGDVSLSSLSDDLPLALNREEAATGSSDLRVSADTQTVARSTERLDFSIGQLTPPSVDPTPPFHFAPVASDRADDEVAELLEHVARLEQSRNRLLSTGVYKESDEIIVDMTRRIASVREELARPMPHR